MSDLLEEIGLEAFGTGEIRTRNQQHWQASEVRVSKIWCAYLLPGFLPIRLLCARIEAPPTHRVLLEAPIFPPGARRVLRADLDGDPLEAAFQTVTWPVKSESSCLDGIAYSLVFETPKFRTRMHFANPIDPHLRAIESALLSVVHTVIGENPSADAQRLIETLEAHTQPRLKDRR